MLYMSTIIQEADLLQPNPNHHVALRGHVMNASPPTALENKINTGINIILSIAAFLLFYLILLQMSDRLKSQQGGTYGWLHGSWGRDGRWDDDSPVGLQNRYPSCT